MINPPNNNKFIGLQDQQTLGQLNDPLQAEQDFLAKRMSQPVPAPGDQSPMMQTNYPHARVKQRGMQPSPKPVMTDHVGGVQEAFIQPIQKEMQKPYKTGYERIVRSKVPEMKIFEEPARIQQQVQKISPFRQDDPGTKYKAVNVQDLEDMGRIKKDKIGQYVVNSNEMKTGTSRDTLRLPKNAKHYSGKKYKTGQMIDESDFEDFTKQYNK